MWVEIHVKMVVSTIAKQQKQRNIETAYPSVMLTLATGMKFSQGVFKIQMPSTRDTGMIKSCRDEIQIQHWLGNDFLT